MFKRNKGYNDDDGYHDNIVYAEIEIYKTRKYDFALYSRLRLIFTWRAVTQKTPRVRC
jgi:hypothetical protein